MYTTFANGTAFTAEEAQALLEQGIPVFADATARDNAIAAPQVGQHCYLLTTQRAYVYNDTYGWIECLLKEDTGWTSMTLASGWTTSMAKYKVLNGVVYFHIEATHAAWTAGTLLWTVPAAYLPTSVPQTFIGVYQGTFYELNLNYTTGALNIQAAGNGGIWVSGSYPLGA